MVVAAQAAVLYEAVGEVGAAMGAVGVDQAIGARAVFVEDEVLAHEPDRLRWPVVHLGHGSERHPVAAHELAEWRAGADLGQEAVLVFAERLVGSFGLLAGMLSEQAAALNRPLKPQVLEEGLAVRLAAEEGAHELVPVDGAAALEDHAAVLEAEGRALKRWQCCRTCPI